MNTWVGLFILLVLISATFVVIEARSVAIHRYRLRHLVLQKLPNWRIQRLLESPDSLTAVLVLIHLALNSLIVALATILCVAWFGTIGILIAALSTALLFLIFAELIPKFIPQSRQQPTSYFAQHQQQEMQLMQRQQKMLLKIIELEHEKVEDIMVPRHEIIGIDLEGELTRIIEQIANVQHTRLPLYQGDINNVIGILHLRRVFPLLQNNCVTKAALTQLAARELYFIPEGTPLHLQLFNFQQSQRHIGLVVNEYGDIKGLITLEDILQEIVGADHAVSDYWNTAIHPQADGSLIVDASISLRELNRALHWHLPMTSAKTLNGLIVDYLEAIPEQGTSLRLYGYIFEIVQVSNNTVRRVKIRPYPLT